mgnify:FL=1
MHKYMIHQKVDCMKSNQESGVYKLNLGLNNLGKI